MRICGGGGIRNQPEERAAVSFAGGGDGKGAKGLIGISDKVKQTLNALGVPVWHDHPQNWTILPAVTWRESLNRECAQADAGEHLAELEYSIDVWSGSAAVNAELTAKIDAAFAAMRLRRTYSAELFESATRVHHRAIRYRCVADAAGNIYQ